MFGKVFVFMVALVVSTGPALAAGIDRHDYQILRDVSAAVKSSPNFTIFDDVSVGVQQGIVTLTGKVTMGHKREEFAKRAGGVTGVRQVVNEINLLPASTWDDELRQQVSRAIYGNSSFWNYAAMSNPPIHIIVEGSRVTLTGVVQSEVDRRLAQVLATQIGVLSVTNNLRTQAEMQASRDQAY
jgi:osmotically-inducible protein OsmY